MKYLLDLIKEALLIKDYGMALRNTEKVVPKLKRGSLQASHLSDIKRSILDLKKMSLSSNVNSTEEEKCIQSIDNNINLIEQS